MQRIRWLLGLGAAIFFILLTLGWFTQRVIFEKVVEQAQFYGFDQAGFDDLSFSFNGIKIKGIYFSHSKEKRYVSARSIHFNLNLSSILRRKIDTIEVEGIRIYDDAHHIKGLIYLIHQYDKFSSSAFINVNADGIAYVQSDSEDYIIPLSLNFENHALKRQLSGYFKVLSDNFSARLNVYCEKNGQDLKFDFYLDDLKGTYEGLSYFAKHSEMNFYPLEYNASLAQSYGAKFAVIEAGIGKKDIQNGAYVPVDLILSGMATLGEGIFHIESAGNLNISGHSIAVNAQTNDEKFKIDVNSETSADVKLARIVDTYNSNQLKNLSGEIKAISQVVIPFSLAGMDGGDTLSSLGQKLMEIVFSPLKDGVLELNFNNFGFAYEGLEVSGLLGKLNFSLFPFTSRGSQKLNYKEMKIHKDLILTEGNADFSFKEVLKIENFRSNVNGGSLNLHSFQNERDGSVLFNFEIKNVDLEKSLSLFDLDQLSGQGNMSGAGQIRHGGKGYEIVNAKFFSEGKSGRVQYRQNIMHEESDLNAETSEALAFRILQDLHYTHLGMEIFPNEGKLQAKLDIMGYNPSVLNSHPFQFKIQTDGNLEEVLSTSLRNFRLPKG